jgi:hypothetical protein
MKPAKHAIDPREPTKGPLEVCILIVKYNIKVPIKIDKMSSTKARFNKSQAI